MTAIATIVAPVLGPTLGGLIIEHTTWRWIFFVNIPFGAVALVLNGLMVEDPPWEKAKQQRKTRGIDYIGLSLIVVGLGCMQIMLDRGEDDDWFGSGFIQIMALLAFTGIFGAICWLLTATRPIINLDVFRDRNFAMGCVLIAAMGMILYSSAVLIPQFSQQQLGYTALLSGLILSPGGIVVIVMIPIVGQLMKIVQTRYIVMFGFAFMGFALMYSSRLVPNIDFRTLVLMRSLQTAALGFLFVPISTIAYLTLPQPMRSDGAALFSMFRNVGGAVGISAATALVTERRPGRPGPSVGVHDAAEPGIQHADPADRAESADARPRLRARARPRGLADIPDLSQTRRRCSATATCSPMRRWWRSWSRRSAS